jgi:hypothetical protein
MHFSQTDALKYHDQHRQASPGVLQPWFDSILPRLGGLKDFSQELL